MRTTRLLAAIAATGLLLVGCSADDTSGVDFGSGSDSAEPQSGVVDDMDERATEDSGVDADTAGPVDGEAADDVVTFGGTGDAVVGRQLARTASVVLEVADVEQAATRVAAAADRAGGFVSDAEVRGGDFGSGRLRLRVPAGRLDATVEDLAAIGTRVVESSISTEDLTDQLTDLEARITNLQRLETELQALLTDVRGTDPSATELLQVFERINQVRGEIERLEAQQAGARDRVALATINVELLPPSTAPEEVEPEPQSTLEEAWRTTRDAFRAIGDALIWVGVTVLPISLVVLGVPALLIWLLVRLSRRRRADRLAGMPPVPAGPATPPGDVGDGPPPPGDAAAAPPPGVPDQPAPAPTGDPDDRADDDQPAEPDDQP